jgi:phosphatidylglycerophosphate synthase
MIWTNYLLLSAGVVLLFQTGSYLFNRLQNQGSLSKYRDQYNAAMGMIALTFLCLGLEPVSGVFSYAALVFSVPAVASCVLALKDTER